MIVDDIHQVRQGLATVLKLAGSSAGARIEIAGEACNGQQAIEQAQALQPDVVLMDLEMPVLDGYTATRQIKLAAPAIRIVALSIHSNPDLRQMALVAGADVFVEKGAPLEELIQAILSQPDKTNMNGVEK